MIRPPYCDAAGLARVYSDDTIYLHILYWLSIVLISSSFWSICPRLWYASAFRAAMPCSLQYWTYFSMSPSCAACSAFCNKMFACLFNSASRRRSIVSGVYPSFYMNERTSVIGNDSIFATSFVDSSGNLKYNSFIRALSFWFIIQRFYLLPGKSFFK